MPKDFFLFDSTTDGISVPKQDQTITATGSVQSGKKVVVGTNFNELKSGDWILSLTSMERRRIHKVIDDNHLELHKPFLITFSPFTFDVVRAEDCKAVYMELTPTGATIDGFTVPDGIPVSFGNKNDSGADTKFIRPRFVSGAAIVNLEYFNNEFAD